MKAWVLENRFIVVYVRYSSMINRSLIPIAFITCFVSWWRMRGKLLPVKWPHQPPDQHPHPPQCLHRCLYRRPHRCRYQGRYQGPFQSPSPSPRESRQTDHPADVYAARVSPRSASVCILEPLYILFNVWVIPFISSLIPFARDATPYRLPNCVSELSAFDSSAFYDFICPPL